MREAKDRSGKWLLTHHGDALLRLAGLTGFRSWRPAPAEVVTPLDAPDGLLELFYDDCPEPTPALIEIATFPERRGDDQALFDVLSVLLARRQVPEVLTVVLCPKGQLRLTGAYERQSRSGGTKAAIRWQVLELWTVPAEQLLAANDVGLMPWLLLTQFAGPPLELLRTCRERIDAQASPDERANLLAVSQILGRLRYNKADLLAFFGGNPPMIESPLIDELMAWRMHKAILRVLTDRFGQVPIEVEQALRLVQDEARLDSLISWAATCPDIPAFAERLASGA